RPGGRHRRAARGAHRRPRQGDHRGLPGTRTPPRRSPQGRVHVHERPRPRGGAARGVRLHGGVLVRERHQDERRRPHREGPRHRPERAPRDPRGGHRRQRAHALLRPQEPARPGARVARGVRAARARRAPEARPAAALRRVSHPPRLRDRLRARHRRAVPEPALRVRVRRSRSVGTLRAPMKKIFRSAPFWIVMVLVAMLLVAGSLKGGSERQAFTLDRFYAQLSAGKVRTAEILDRDHEIKGELASGTKYKVSFPERYAEKLTADVIAADNVSVTTNKQSDPVWWAILQT